MNPKRFLISSLLLAGFLPPQNAQAALPADPSFEQPKNKATLFDIFKRDHIFELAGHRSHSSHSSHRSHSSHSSHRSSTGGGGVYVAPQPLYSPPAPAAPAKVAPKVLPGNTNKFMLIVMQVQTALYAYGYYTGAIDGVVGPATKVAISTMQAQYGLPVTGTITPDVLNALQVTAE